MNFYHFALWLEANYIVINLVLWASVVVIVLSSIFSHENSPVSPVSSEIPENSDVVETEAPVDRYTEIADPEFPDVQPVPEVLPEAPQPTIE